MENNRLILHIAPQKDVFCPFDPLDSCAGKKPSELLQEELHRFKKAKLIIIDLNYTLTGDFEGIDLLRLIRLHHIKTHCIVYSFLPESYHVRMDANKSILMSEGVTFVQMPQVIDDKTMDFDTLIKKESDENLEDYFLHDYKLFFSDNRHFNANWWAPLRIMEYLKRADKIEDEDLLYSNPESKNRKTSYYGLVLRYIKTLKEHSVWDRKVEDIIAENKLLEEKNKQLEDAKTNIAQAVAQAVESSLSDDSLKRQVITSTMHPINQEIDVNQSIIDAQQPEVDDYRQARETEHSENAATVNIEALRDKLAVKKPKILYVDDMAGYGWDFVLQRLIYREEKPKNFDTWPFFPKEAIEYEELAETIISKAQTDQLDLIIMDLRLKDERGEMKPKDLSGIKLLEALRKNRIACPILIITASKNPETIEQVYTSGADACWRKEGIDENNSTDPAERVAYTWGKIEQLLILIDVLCGDEFKFLYQTMLKKYYHGIEQSKAKYWWEDVGNHNITGMESISKEDFLKHLNNAILAYQNTLVNKLKGKVIWYDFLIPCEAMFAIMEEIHPGRAITDKKGRIIKIKGFGELLNLDYNLDPKRTNNSQLDYFLQDVFEAIRVRNDIIHPDKHAKKVSIDDFKKCVSKLIDGYLSCPYDRFMASLPQVSNQPDNPDQPQNPTESPKPSIPKGTTQHIESDKPTAVESDSKVGCTKITIETEWQNQYALLRPNKVHVNDGQPVSFMLKFHCKYVLYEVQHTPDDVSSDNNFDYAYIKNLKNEEGSLWCQLSDMRIHTRKVSNNISTPSLTEAQTLIRFTPTAFKKGDFVNIDLAKNKTNVWEGLFSSQPISNKKTLIIIDKMQCLDSDVWFKIFGNDVSLKIGDSIQFKMGGACTILATDVKPMKPL